jgi:hypothetical protein
LTNLREIVDQDDQDDVDLKRLVTVWPRLSPEIKAAVLAVTGVDESEGQRQ